MLIRRALPEDAPAIVDLRDGAARWMVGRGIDQWRPGEVSAADVLGWLATGRVYVADRDDALVGVVRVAWSDPETWGGGDAAAGYVHALISARTVAGQGIGAALLTRAETVIGSTGRRLARLDCVASNDALVAYYQARGYAVVGGHEFAPDTGWPPVTLLEKPLS